MGGGNDNQWFISPNIGCAQRQGTPIHGNMSAGKAASHCDHGLNWSTGVLSHAAKRILFGCPDSP